MDTLSNLGHKQQPPPAPAGRDIYQEYLHYTYTHYAVLSHYCKEIFCENSNVRGFFGPHELSLIFSGGMCLELTSL